MVRVPLQKRVYGCFILFPLQCQSVVGAVLAHFASVCSKRVRASGQIKALDLISTMRLVSFGAEDSDTQRLQYPEPLIQENFTYVKSY